jgi:hypothetical protein
MDISSACLPPIQPDSARCVHHPRYSEYRRYVSALSIQLVTALSFESWLQSTEEFENGRETVFHTLPAATIAQGWYKHVFLPKRRDPIRLGPFATEAEAHAASHAPARKDLQHPDAGPRGDRYPYGDPQ